VVCLSLTFRALVQGGDESGRTSGVTTIAALIRPPWKLLLGEGPGDILDMAGHPGPLSPNNSATVDWKNVTQVCGRTPSTGCLYNVYEDPEERRNLAAQQPELYGTMMAAIKELNQGVFSPSRGVDDGVACKQVEVNGGFWGPFVFP
jgi:arylsulfatase B